LLAYLMVSGQGGVADATRGFRLYQLAAENGDPDAQNNLGEIYESGRGVEKNPALALQWYERGAASGHGSAQFNAGRMWAIGVSGKSDPAKARVWLVQAENKGIKQARQVLDWLDQQTSVAASEAVSKGGVAEIKDSKAK
jgi:TPR repeat protein